MVDEPSRRRILDSPLGAEVARSLGGEPLVRDREGRLVTTRRSGACVFLAPDGLCRVHSSLGPEAKPRTCRQFPFLLASTPDGVFVGASFACPAVRSGEGALLEEAREEILSLLAEAPPVPFEPIPLGDGRTMGWERYLDFEGRLRSELASRPPSEVLREALAAAVGGGPPSPAREALEAFTAARFVGWLEYPGDAARGEAVAAALREGRGPVRLPRFSWEGSVEDLARAKTRLGPSSELEPTVRRYLDALLLRKMLTRDRPLPQGLALLHMVPPLARWYATTAAALRGAPAAGREDLDLALEVCEMELVTHARGQEPLLRDFLRLWRPPG